MLIIFCIYYLRQRRDDVSLTGCLSMNKVIMILWTN